MKIFAKKAPQEPIISEEKLEKLIEILSEIGLTPRFGFDVHVLRPESYSGGYFEWTERFNGVRFLLDAYGTPLKLQKVRILNYDQDVLTDEQITDYERRVAELLES